MTNTEIIIQLSGNGFKEYHDCLKEYRGKNTLTFVNSGEIICEYGPAIVYPDDTVRWFGWDGEVTRSEWIESMKVWRGDKWDLDFKGDLARVLLTYSDAPGGVMTLVDGLRYVSGLDLLGTLGMEDRAEELL